MRVIGMNSNDGYVPVFRNNRDEVFYLCDLNKCISVNEIVIVGKDAIVLTKYFDYAIVTDTFSEAYNILENFVLFQNNGYGLEYSVEIGKLYTKENLIVTY